jgi:hypothetical protein
MNSIVPELLELLDRMRVNLRVTAEAYSRPNINFFGGDWKEDKLRARRIFFNIMSHLDYLSGMVGYEERGELYKAAEAMTAEWIALDTAMDEKAKEKKGHTVCKYFRNRHPVSWKQSMADTILTLDEDAKYAGEDDFLVLLCFEKIKLLLLSAIEKSRWRKKIPGKFNADRILVISQEDVPFNCTTCLEMTDSAGTQVPEGEYPSGSFAEIIHAMRGSSCPMRPRPKRVRPEDMVAAEVEKTHVPQKKHTTMQWLRDALMPKKK